MSTRRQVSGRSVCHLPAFSTLLQLKGRWAFQAAEGPEAGLHRAGAALAPLPHVWECSRPCLTSPLRGSTTVLLRAVRGAQAALRVSESVHGAGVFIAGW